MCRTNSPLGLGLYNSMYLSYFHHPCDNMSVPRRNKFIYKIFMLLWTSSVELDEDNMTLDYAACVITSPLC